MLEKRQYRLSQPLGLPGTAPGLRELSPQIHSLIHTVISCGPSTVRGVRETCTAKPGVVPLWDSTDEGRDRGASK